MSQTKGKGMELQELVTKRGRVKAKLTRVETFVSKFTDNDNVHQLVARLEQIGNILTEYEQIQDKIEPLDKEQTNDRDVFETQYYNVISDIKTLIERFAPKKPVETPPLVQSPFVQTMAVPMQPHLNVTLPALNLPSFGGCFTQWTSFHDTFDTLINQNNSLSDTQKFHYLKSCLVDEAARAIDSLTISNANYNAAWQILTNRYKNTRLIVQEHVNKILNTPQINKLSHQALRVLLDDIITNIEALKVLNMPTASWDAIIVPIISSKLDFITRRDWEGTLNTNVPELITLINFLEKKYQLQVSLNPINKGNNTYSNNYNNNQFNSAKNKFRITNHAAAISQQCPFCKNDSHKAHQCSDFMKLNVPDRIQRSKALKLCQNCLKGNHKTTECRFSGCRHCGHRHNTLLHLSQQLSTNANPSQQLPTNANLTQANSEIQIVNNHCTASGQILLSTAIVQVRDRVGNFQNCRALLDGGSQIHFISEKFTELIGFKTNSVNLPVLGVNQMQSNIKKSVNIYIRSMYTDFATNMQCFVLPQVTSYLPPVSIDISSYATPNIKLADPDFNKSQQIDLLIGAELFWRIMCTNKIDATIKNPHFQETLLGWIAGGPLPNDKVGNRRNSPPTCNFTSLTSTQVIQSQLEKFWELESMPLPLELPHNESEMHFKQTTRRDSEGRFIVKLPFKQNKCTIGDSYKIAQQRFFNLEKRFNRDPKLKEAYVDFMQDYEKLNHMKKVTNYNDPNLVYIPHHAVFKITNSESKIRVVFDASAKTSNNKSLNDNLVTGPPLQQNLLSILTRFRTHQYVISGDITKMYRQIKIDEGQTNCQTVIWRENSDEPLEHYNLLTVTYGTTCAPYLAVRCLNELAHENQSIFPSACKIILRDFYMDDLLTGTNTIQEAIKLRQEISLILSKGCFQLGKWATNNPEIISDISVSNNTSDVNFDKLGETKTLGLFWNCVQDLLKYKINVRVDKNKITKRTILATIAQIFDPLNLIGPVIVLAKILLQQLWAANIGWDCPVPLYIRSQWEKFVSQLHHLSNLKIPRKVISQCTDTIELHAFCDASERAYGAAVYIRIPCDNTYSVRLLCAKSRVAPIKSITLPRLELSGALLLAQLVDRLEKTLSVKINKRYFWTDSSIVLAWLASEPQTWKTFVANRVAEIQSYSKCTEWSHVRSQDNPADLISRGVMPSQLENCTLWWEGPPWLSLTEHSWPKRICDRETIIQNEEKKATVTLTHLTVSNELPIIKNISSFAKLKRIIALCERFVFNCRNKNNKRSGPISINELNLAEIAIIKNIQAQEFNLEIYQLKSQIQLKRNHKLLALNPFLDNCGILRVGGRIRNANIAYDKKFPIILPKGHHITESIIREEHVTQLHGGISATLASVRRKFWPICGRNEVKKVIHKCVTCFRNKPNITNQMMADLPLTRLEPLRPFLKCGVDYCGPILIKQGGIRSKQHSKAYVALFVCFSTKAVHIELVNNLTTESFLNAFKRFISRRGYVSDIYSDNATNFVGAAQEFHKLLNSDIFKTEVIQKLTADQIKWHFIPPRAPHHGGLWERAIKSVKHHLKRIAGEASLTYEELYTLLTRIEACLNSRPLIPLSNDPNDLDALTPSHFLIGESLTAPIESNLTPIKVNRLTRWQRIEQLRQHFWGRWSQEYIIQLQGRTKWKTGDLSKQLQIGQLVILKEDNAPPLRWTRGRILEVHPGRDNIVRVVSIKTPSGILKRSINKVAVLPVEV